MKGSDSTSVRAENVERCEPHWHSTPNAQLRIAEDILAILHKWGIHTLGQFAALNRDDLGARLGLEAIRLWERANGKTK